MEETKTVHTIILDTGAVIANEPPISTLLSKANKLVTIPAVVDELKSQEARSRFDTTWRPFVELREPRSASLTKVTDFARRTGDLPVLSRQDLQVLALAYEIECELEGSDWRLRNAPGQKELNGKDPLREVEGKSEETGAAGTNGSEASEEVTGSNNTLIDRLHGEESTSDEVFSTKKDKPGHLESSNDPATEQKLAAKAEGVSLDATYPVENDSTQAQVTEDGDGSEGDDSDGWITPSNIKKYQAMSERLPASAREEQRTMKVATITRDFAMQNVLLQMNLYLISPSFMRIRQVKTSVLRCHACFNIVKDMAKQFCPRCGKPTLTRVTCMTDEKGEFKIFLKKNMQWNKRGDRYSIPKPVGGSPSGRVNVGGGGKGGGKGGWGQRLILAEDQKEYVRAIDEQKRLKERNLMDEDYLPSILSGERGKFVGQPKIGAGRTVNSRKRL